MTLQALLFDEEVDQTALVEGCARPDLTFATFGGEAVELDKVTSMDGALCGATLNPIKRIGDIQNTVSLSTAGMYLSADRFKESSPYYREYDVDGNLEILITVHFLLELRRQLAGDIEDGTSTFSPKEKKFYEDFQLWQLGDTTYLGIELAALEALDNWLVDELVGNPHPTLDRTYNEVTHPWRKTLEREE